MEMAIKLQTLQTCGPDYLLYATGYTGLPLIWYVFMARGCCLRHVHRPQLRLARGRAGASAGFSGHSCLG
ncbi:hypothetical protein EOV40_003385 [Acetobacter oryzoeni]|uniref:Uncharacterized protein n=1 Tax=Acetobacter oryzoeni TaxID=2500548 RepID=A0A5B9GFD5_9PROT|nr:hypothetical protein EOV40_003385 [Acetobacter oryzoeni]